MRKKIRDLTLEDMPKCWNKLLMINEALIILITAKSEELLNYAKSTIPNDILDMEVNF